MGKIDIPEYLDVRECSKGFSVSSARLPDRGYWYTLVQFT